MKGSWRAVRIALIPAGIAALILAAAGAVMAVRQTNPLELDGNAVDDPGGGVDWANIYAPQTQAAAGQRAFIVDVSGPNADNIFTQGGSKDTSPISEWRHATGNVPDKDDILNAFAAAYNVDGSLTLYFGADRWSNNGDAQIGVWFFRNRVMPQPDGTFSGSHTNGDVLVLSNFIGGGDTTNLQVYRWRGDSDPGNPLALVAQATADGASSACTAGDLACAFTNTGGESAPWPYAPKSGAAGSFPAASFFEGGIDLSAVLGENGLGCHSSFIMETRSSQEPTAQLKDLVAGSLELCGLTVSQTADVHSKATDPVTYRFTIENTGLVTLYAQDIRDTVNGDLSSVATEAGCDALGPGERCEFSFPYTVQADDPDPLINTMTATYQTGSGDPVTVSAQQQTNLFQPSIAFSNIGNATSATVGEQISYVLSLRNTSSADSPNLTCTIRDSLANVSEKVNVAAGGQHVVTAVYTVKASDPATLVNVGSVRCQVDGFPNILEATSEYTVTINTAAPPPPTTPPTDPPTDVPPTDPPTQPPTDEPTSPPTEPPATEPPATEEEPSIQDEPTETPAPTATPVPTEEPTRAPEPTRTPRPTRTPKPEKTDEPEATQEAQGEPSSGIGCSPGFWQGGNGRWLWNDANDPDWQGAGTNPFTHETPFNSFFAPYDKAEGLVMFDLVRGGGGNKAWRKAARNVVAGYLNASYGNGYPFSAQEVAQMWADAVSGARSFNDVHNVLGEANNWCHQP